MVYKFAAQATCFQSRETKLFEEFKLVGSTYWLDDIVLPEMVWEAFLENEKASNIEGDDWYFVYICGEVTLESTYDAEGEKDVDVIVEIDSESIVIEKMK